MLQSIDTCQNKVQRATTILICFLSHMILLIVPKYIDDKKMKVLDALSNHRGQWS